MFGMVNTMLKECRFIIPSCSRPTHPAVSHFRPLESPGRSTEGARVPNHSRVTRRLGLKVALAAAVTVPLSSTALSASTASAEEHRAHRLGIMSFNLRFASTAEPNSWTVRRPVMRELLRRERPHVIGTQEGLYQQLRDIDSDLGPHYDWIGTGREGGSSTSSTPTSTTRASTHANTAPPSWPSASPNSTAACRSW
jgi:hypothetical protein